MVTIQIINCVEIKFHRKILCSIKPNSNQSYWEHNIAYAYDCIAINNPQSPLLYCVYGIVAINQSNRHVLCFIIINNSYMYCYWQLITINHHTVCACYLLAVNGNSINQSSYTIHSKWSLIIIIATVCFCLCMIVDYILWNNHCKCKCEIIT